MLDGRVRRAVNVKLGFGVWSKGGASVLSVLCVDVVDCKYYVGISLND
jgi:hypothetical protein